MVLRTLSIASLVGLGAVLAAGGGSAQTLKDVVGAWTLVSVVVEQGEKRIEPYGANPKGSMIYNDSGRFSITITRSGLPKIASNNRETSTAEESTAIAHGSIAYFGTYTYSEPDRVMTVKIEGSTFPNWEGVEQKRVIAISGDILTLTNPTVSSGAGVAKVTWRRAK
jgi:hypothetical protein